MTALTIERLHVFGPDTCERVSLPDARAMCRRLALSRYENFIVLSRLVPRDLWDDFAAVYGFCRWADDLGDEVESPQRAMSLLAWWRDELGLCYAGEPRHPVFVALQPTVERFDLPRGLFEDLITAFERDQTVTRYDTWTQLLDYCRLSANPVGRLVLTLFSETSGHDADEKLQRSDQICTALQLTNHWQDVRRDLLERDRIYIPRELNPMENFEDRFRRSARQGYGCDRAFLGETRGVIKACVDRTWPLFEQGMTLVDQLGPRARPVIWLLGSGGMHVLRSIEQWNYETALHRPRLGWVGRLGLVFRAWMLRGRGPAGAKGTA